jgi:tight adherence protein B
MNDTAMMAIVVGALLMLATLLAGGYVMVRASHATYRKRLALVSGELHRERRQRGGAKDSSGKRRSQIQSKIRELEEQRKKNVRKQALKDLLLQAGSSLSVKQFYIFSAVFAIVATALYLLMGYPLWGALPVAVVALLGVPRIVLKRKAKKRQKLFTKHFANSIDIIVRGVRSGLPVNECLRIIAREAPEPVASEFDQLIEGIKIGQPLDDVMQRGLRRIPTTEYKFFAIVLAIQQQTGSNLAETLAGLSTVLRERKKMADQVKSITSEARTTAMIIGSLPFCMAAVMTLTSYEYIALLWREDMGHYMIAGGLTLIAMGTFIMWRMISFEV